MIAATAYPSSMSIPMPMPISMSMPIPDPMQPFSSSSSSSSFSSSLSSTTAAAVAAVTAATAAAATATGIHQQSIGSLSHGYHSQSQPPMLHSSYSRPQPENNYRYTSTTSTTTTSSTATKRWMMPMAASVTSAVAGQLAPGRTMTDLCTGMLTSLFSNLTKSTERPELRLFVQSILEASAVSANVVLLALYYLRQTTKDTIIRLPAIVVDINGTRLDGGDKNAPPPISKPSVQLRLRFVAALACAHKFDADAAYTTRTWADLGNLEVPELVRAERELLAHLRFQLSVTRDELNAFRVELDRCVSGAANSGNSSSSSNHNKAPQLPRLSICHGLSPLRCSCASCVIYPGDAISPATSPTGIWSPNSLHALDNALRWPSMPTPEDTLTTAYPRALYGRSFQSTSTMTSSIGMTSDVSLLQTAPTTMMAMPEPQVWTGFSYSTIPSTDTTSSLMCTLDAAFSSSAATTIVGTGAMPKF